MFEKEAEEYLGNFADCETCKHYDEDLEKEDKEPCKNCFYDNSFWELKEVAEKFKAEYKELNNVG